MKKGLLCFVHGLSVFVLLGLTKPAQAENDLQEKRLKENLEKFITGSRKSDGNFSTISLRSWRNELAMPPLSTEDMIRKVLDAFENHYKNLKVQSYSVVYTSRPNGGIECDFLIIRHQTEAAKTYRFATK